jgi:Ankyrin repeats (many copies)
MLLDAGADIDLPWTRWDVGRRPLALAARCGHLAAYELLAARGATADLDEVDAAVLAVARGTSVRLPKAPPPALGIRSGDDYGWILGQFASLGRTEVVRALLDAGMGVDTRGWSNFTPLDQAAMHGRTEVVRLLIERGADLDDCAFDEDGPTPLDCALWGCGTTAPTTATTRAPCRHCWRPAHPPSRRLLPATRRSTHCSPGTQPQPDHRRSRRPHGAPTHLPCPLGSGRDAETVGCHRRSRRRPLDTRRCRAKVAGCSQRRRWRSSWSIGENTRQPTWSSRRSSQLETARTSQPPYPRTAANSIEVP